MNRSVYPEKPCGFCGEALWFVEMRQTPGHNSAAIHRTCCGKQMTQKFHSPLPPA